MPIAVHYFTKTGKTGEEMKDLFLTQVRILQVCKACLQRTPAVELTVELSQEETCCSVCETCLADEKVCEECAKMNQPSHVPSLRTCRSCLNAGEQCVRCAVLILTADCEEGNKKAMEIVRKMQEDGSIDPALQCLAFFSR